MFVGVWTVHRQQDLFRVLKAYTLYRPEEGYCQAQAPIAAVLLMHMPAEVLLPSLFSLSTMSIDFKIQLWLHLWFWLSSPVLMDKFMIFFFLLLFRVF